MKTAELAGANRGLQTHHYTGDEGGTYIEIADQDGSSMFPKGSKTPYERMRVIVQKHGKPLKSTPYRVSITGHTAATGDAPKSDYGKWGLAIDRANPCQNGFGR
jgi:flagellar motor protein MotB